MPRLIVVQPKDRRWPELSLPVGVVRDRGRATVVVRLTVLVAGGRPAPQQEALVPMSKRGSPGFLVPGEAASFPARVDFAPVAQLCDDYAEPGAALVLEPERAWPTANGELVLSWRGRLPARSERLLVTLEEAGVTRTLCERLGDVARMRVQFAEEPDGLPPDAIDEAELCAARAERYEHTPEPALGIDRYAAIAAELSVAEVRAEVLARHGLDEELWLLEERGWLARLGEEALAGDGTTAASFGAAFLAAQAALGTDDLALLMHEYVGVRARLEHDEEPQQALSSWGISVGQWLRLEHFYAEKLAADPVLAAELDRQIAEELARLEAEKPAQDGAEE